MCYIDNKIVNMMTGGTQLSELALLVGFAQMPVPSGTHRKFVPPPTGGRAQPSGRGERAAGVERCQRSERPRFPPGPVPMLIVASEGLPCPVAASLVEPDWAALRRHPAALFKRIAGLPCGTRRRKAGRHD